MAWVLSEEISGNADHITAALLAAGKALYLANRFEEKCKYFLKVRKLIYEKEEGTDPIASLQQTLESLVPGKMLGPTLHDLSELLKGTSKEDALGLLGRAKDARNFIAHEGANFGDLLQGDRYVTQHLRTLRGAVVDLAHGDNAVSSWIYELQSSRFRPPSSVERYVAIVERWVFGDAFAQLVNDVGYP